MHNDTHFDDAMINFMRHRSIKEYYKSVDDVYQFRQAFPEINFRYYIKPNATLVGGIGEIDFNNKTTWKMQEAGRKDGEFHYHTGEGFFFKKMDEWRDSKQLRIKFPTL